MEDTLSPEQYIARIEYLEENRRYVHEALEKALSMGDFQVDLNKHGSSDHILLQAQQRINQIISFKASALFLVNNDTSDFEMTVCEPSESRNFIQKESDALIDNGFFGWALRERRGVLIESENHSRQFLLHVVSTHSQMKGMFVGILDGQSQSIPESSRYLLSIILLNMANALESIGFHSLMQEQNLILETKVEERTKELEKNIRGLQEEVSKRKQIEEEQKKSKETAEAASTAKGEFLANMSHEIRTPLNGIIGMLEMAMDADLNDDLRDILNTVNTEAEVLLEIINGILDFSKIEAGKLELEEIPFNLRYLLEDLSKGFAFQAEEKQREFQVLLVEDYLTNQKVAISHLKKIKCHVDVVENGLQAVNTFKEKQYDVILMDIQMPVMDGFEATSKIRAYESELEAKTRIPIIAMTAHAIKGYKEQCIEKGMDDYITKPLKRAKFLATVEKWAWQISECRTRINDLDENSCPMPGANDTEPDDFKITDIESDIDGPDMPMDYKKALAEFDGNEEFLMELVNDLLEEIKPQIETIRQAISDNEHEIVTREAHSIKGGAANLAAESLSGVAFELEKAGKAGNSEGTMDHLIRLEKEFLRLAYFCNEKTAQVGG